MHQSVRFHPEAGNAERHVSLLIPMKKSSETSSKKIVNPRVNKGTHSKNTKKTKLASKFNKTNTTFRE